MKKMDIPFSKILKAQTKKPVSQMEDLKITDEDSSKLEQSKFPVARALKLRQTGIIHIYIDIWIDRQTDRQCIFSSLIGFLSPI